MPRKKSERPFNKSQYDQEYTKKNLYKLHISFNRIHEKDLIDFLESIPNKTGFIKRLIRSAIPASGGDQANARADHTETEPEAKED